VRNAGREAGERGGAGPNRRTLFAQRRCPQLDSFVHRSMTLHELHDLEDQLCPMLTPTLTTCVQTVVAQLQSTSAAERKLVTDALCQEPPSEPQRTGN
jgi:hypothetical protein